MTPYLRLILATVSPDGWATFVSGGADDTRVELEHAHWVELGRPGVIRVIPGEEVQ